MREKQPFNYREFQEKTLEKTRRSWAKKIEELSTVMNLFREKNGRNQLIHGGKKCRIGELWNGIHSNQARYSQISLHVLGKVSCDLYLDEQPTDLHEKRAGYYYAVTPQYKLVIHIHSHATFDEINAWLTQTRMPYAGLFKELLSENLCNMSVTLSSIEAETAFQSLIDTFILFESMP